MIGRIAIMALVMAAAGTTRAWAIAGAPPPPAATLFPLAEGALETAAAIILRPSPKSVVKLTPVRFVPRPGASQYRDTHFCGVVLNDGTGLQQGVVTIGVGYTETLMCGELLAAGIVPPKSAAGIVSPKSAGASRIGLIYRAGTLRSALRTPVVLARDPMTKRWSVDETATAAMDAGQPARTIADIRRKLSPARKR